MLKRVKGIAPIRGAHFDAEPAFSPRRGFADGSGGDSFDRHLQQAMKNRRQAAKKAEESASDAYALEIERPTHSLFYAQRATLKGLESYIHEL